MRKEKQEPVFVDLVKVCRVCKASIVWTYPNPDDDREVYFVCSNGHHEHSITFVPVGEKKR